MGCRSSKLLYADDSIHVMLSHADKHGKSTYVPRQPHPLLLEAVKQSLETDAETTEEFDTLLYHTAHHNDTIDPRDLAEYCDGSQQQQDDTEEAQSS